MVIVSTRLAICVPFLNEWLRGVKELSSCSITGPIWEGEGPETLGEAPLLPLSFPPWWGVGAVGSGNGLPRVGRGGLRMGGHVGRRRCMPGGACRRDRGTLGLPRGGVCGEGELSGLDHSKIACSPSTTGLNRLAWSLITRMYVLEVRQHMLRAVSGPQRQCLVVQPHARSLLPRQLPSMECLVNY